MKLRSRDFSSFANLIDLIFSLCHSIDVNRLAMVFWLIWNRRNLAWQQEKAIDLQLTSKLARALLQEFLAAQTSRVRPFPTTPRHTRRSPPYDPFYKINFDGVVFCEDGATGIGVVIRNSLGSMICSFAQWIPLPSSMDIVEALACKRVIQLAKEICIFEAIFEGDSEVVVKALQAQRTSSPNFELILRDTLLLVSDLRNVLFSHVKRTSNSVAHYLAKSAKSSNEL